MGGGADAPATIIFSLFYAVFCLGTNIAVGLTELTSAVQVLSTSPESLPVRGSPPRQCWAGGTGWAVRR